MNLFFSVLNNGCLVEALQLTNIGNQEQALAVFMVVAWRIARGMRRGRTRPESCLTLTGSSA